MLHWLQRFIMGRQRAERPPSLKAAPEPPAPPVSVMTVVNRYLTANPQRTPHGVHALIAAGAAKLADPGDVPLACAKIQNMAASSR